MKDDIITLKDKIWKNLFLFNKIYPKRLLFNRIVSAFFGETIIVIIVIKFTGKNCI